MNLHKLDEGDQKRLCESLNNTSWHAVLNLLLLLLLIASTIFKVYRSLKHHSTSGLTLMNLFLGVLFNISQVCIGITSSVIEFPGPACLRYVASLGLGALNPLLLLLMSGTVFACTLIVYTLKCATDDSSSEGGLPTTIGAERTGANRRITAMNRPRSLAPYCCLLVIGACFAMFLLPTFLFLIIAPASEGRGLAMYLYYPFMYHLITLPVLAFGQFAPEITFLWRNRQNITDIYLDTSAFAIDAVLFTLVGVSWRLFLASHSPMLLNMWYALTHPLSWQMFGTLMWLDYVVLGLGQGVVLALYIYLKRRHSASLLDKNKRDLEREHDGSGTENETTPLLAEGN